MLRIVCFLLSSLFIFSSNLSAQACSAFGQTPANPRSICSPTSTFQAAAPTCTGSRLAGGCNETPISPYWYRFVCYQTGSLAFTISPTGANEDYDWQLFDVTNHDPNEVYTNASLTVTANWCATYGNTGAIAGGINYIQCASLPEEFKPTYVAMPTIVQGHIYLLMISHYSSTDKGYNLSFLGGTANITTPGVGAITGNTSVCSGSVNTYTTPVTGGIVSYSWALPSGWTGSSLTNTVIATASSLAGSVNVSGVNSCGVTTTATLPVAITTAGTPSVVISSTVLGNSICAGTGVTFFATPVNGGLTPAYQWQKNGVNVGTNSDSYSDNALTNSDVISVTLTSNAACITTATASATSAAILVNTAPTAPGSINGGTAVCPNSTNTYSVAAVAGATSYNWVLAVGWSGTSGTSNITTTATATGGNLSVSASNSCGTSAVATLPVAVTTTATPLVNITNNTTSNTICDGSTVTFKAAPSNGGLTPAYQWKKNGVNVGTNNDSYSDNALTNSDIISVTLTCNAACITTTTASATSADIFVDTAPAAPGSINGGTAVCPNSTNTYSVAAVAGATSYNWALPIGWSGTSATSNITTTATATGGNVTVSASNSCGTSAVATLPVAVTTTATPLVNITNNTTSNTICDGSTVTFKAAPSNGGSAPAYQWQKNGVNVGTNSDSYSDNALTNSNVISITLTSNAACITTATASATSAAITVTTMITPSVVVTNDAIDNTICIGNNVNFTAKATNGGLSPIYQWKKNGVSVGTNSNIYSTNTLTNGDKISITIISDAACVTTSTATATNAAFIVNATPLAPGAITGNTPICPGTTNNYTVPVIANADHYNWTLPTDWTGSSLTNNIITTATTTGGYITVSASNSCGTSGITTMAITVNPSLTPSVSIASNTVANTICIGNNVTFTATPINGGVTPAYQWQKNGENVGGNSDNYSTNTLANSDAVTVTLTSNVACLTTTTATATSAAITINASPLVPGIITGNTSICPASTNTYTIAEIANADHYNWIIPEGWSSNSITNTIATVNNTNSGIMTVYATNTCGSSPAATLAVKVNPTLIPFINIASTAVANTICAGTNVVFTTGTVNPGTAPVYQWQNNGTNVGSNSVSYSSNSLANGDNISVIMVSNAVCVLPNTVSATISAMTVNPLETPTITALSNAGLKVLSGQPVTFTTTYTSAGTRPTFQWFKNGVAITLATNNTYTTNALYNGDEITVKMISNAICLTTATTVSAPLLMQVAKGVDDFGTWTGTLDIYPNPNKGHFTISASWDSSFIGHKVAIELISDIGQILYKTSTIPATKEWYFKVNLPEVATSLYFLRIRTTGLQRVKKVMVLR